MLRFISGLLALALALGSAAAIPAEAAEGREASIRKAGELRVCMWPAYFAISYRNQRSGDLEGIDIDLARAFAADLGVRLSFVDTSFVKFMDDLGADRCDIAMFAVGTTAQRRERVDFSAPYLRSGVYAVTTKAQRRIRGWDDIDQPGVVVAVQAGTFMEPLMRDTLKKATLKVVALPQTREAEIESGRADVFMSDYPYTRMMLRLHDWARIVEPSTPVAPTDYAYAVRKGDAAWLARVNAFVAAIKTDGRLDKAARAHELAPIVVRPADDSSR